MAHVTSAQKELSLIQKGLLAKKLVGPDLPLLKVEEPCRSARLRPGRPDQSEFLPGADKASSSLLEVGLYSDTGIG